MKKGLLTIFIVPIFLLGACDLSEDVFPSPEGGDSSSSVSYNDDIDNGYDYFISIDKTDVPEYLEVGGEGFNLSISLSSSDPSASLTPSEDNLIVTTTSEEVVSIDNFKVTPLARGTTTIKVEWLHHASSYDFINVTVRNKGEEDLSSYTYDISIVNKDEIASEWYVGDDPYELEIEMSSTDPEYENIEANTDTVDIRVVGDTEAVEVDGFKVTPIAEGSVTIRAYFKGHESSYDSLTRKIEGKPILNYTLSFTITYEESPAKASEYGSIYMNYSKVSSAGEWEDSDKWVPLTSTEIEGSYYVTFDKISAGSYEYSLVFVYDGEEASYTYPLFESFYNESFVISEDAEDNGSQTIVTEITTDLTSFPSHENALLNYTLCFSISTNDGYSQQTAYGWNIYIAASFNSWKFEALTYNEVTAGEEWAYTYVFSEIYPGSYEYKLVYCSSDNVGWNNELTPGSDNQVFTVSETDGDDYVNSISIESPFYFADVDYQTRDY
ncbi:MAG: hypothetical protein LUC16_03995 [Coprobacillus sp.]|nr:hypothetical protein [Coprobacillus sp.]